MEICKRRVNMYDTVNQSKTPFITHVAPSTSTNLTMTFNNQLTTVHNQVSGRHQGKVGRTDSGIPHQTPAVFPVLSFWICKLKYLLRLLFFYFKKPRGQVSVMATGTTS